LNCEVQIRSILEYFRQLSAIPRCSGNEQGIAAWLQAWARERNLSSRRDKAGNVLIRVPGPPVSTTEPVILQGHLDMVCVKDPDSSHDFYKDPIRPLFCGEWLTAEGTTLGADNGIAIALALAAADLEERPELELLFTVNEERGLTGAAALEPDFVRGRLLLNLDSEDEGVITAGCAGGREGRLTLPLERRSSTEPIAARVSLNGLPGGHSGVEIHKQRPNAILLLGMLLQEAPCTLVLLSGGVAHNAIPARAEAVVHTSSLSSLEKCLTAALAKYSFYTGLEREGAEVSCKKLPSEGLAPLSNASAERLFHLLRVFPHGVQRMSASFPGIVETSANLSEIHIDKESAIVKFSLRSSLAQALDYLTDKICSLAALCRAQCRTQGEYPGWTPDLDSKLLSTATRVHRETLDRAPKVNVIHAGLECGVISRQIPGMEMISFGPTIQGAHTPKERLHLPGLECTWRFLRALLRRLAC